MSEHIKRIFCFTLAAVLLCALSACVSTPAVSEPESSAAATTAAATTGTSAPTTVATTAETTAAATTGTTADPFYPYGKLFPSEKEARATYEAYKKMSYEEYFSEPRILFTYFQKYRDVLPKSDDPTVLYYESEPDRLYFDAKKYKKDAKEIRSGGYDGDGIVDYFCVDDEIWRWHIPSDTIDVVVKDHGLINGLFSWYNDFGYCTVYHPELGDRGDMKTYVYEHYHVFSKNLVIPYEEVPKGLNNEEIFLWFKENVYK